MRWLPLLAVALVACGGSEPPPATPTPGPHWPGPVAFAAERNGSLDVFVRDGDRTRRLTRAGELSEYPSWSPDGRALVFSGHRAGDFEVLRIDAAGGRSAT